MVAHSGCWHSCAFSLRGLSMQKLPGESREMALHVENEMEVPAIADAPWASGDQGAHTGLDK